MSEHGVQALVRAHAENQAAGVPMVLATVIRSRGSTYRKPGARMLMCADGNATGIVGGGCFDSDLLEQARAVGEEDKPVSLVYDMRSPDEAIWGLGLGCEGEVTLFLQPLHEHGNPLGCLEKLLEADRPGRVVTLLAPAAGMPAGFSWIAEGGNAPVEIGPDQCGYCEGDPPLFVDAFEPPPRLLICGAGVDAVPLARQGLQLGWRVTVLDHRPGHVRADRFPDDVQVAHFDGAVTPLMKRADAAVVMSHNLDADRNYLRSLAQTEIGYLGTLGPAARRARLLEELGDQALAERLRGPVGLDLGGELPEEIALSIAAEIQAYLHDARGQTLTRR